MPNGAGGEDLAFLGIVRGRPAASPADSPADQGIEVSGAVDQFGMVHLQHLAADGEDPRRPFDRSYHLFQKMRLCRSIIVQ